MAADRENVDENTDSSKENTDQSVEFGNLPSELLVKHPLQNKWTLWFIKNDRTKDWTENLLQVTSFDTVEDFWALYNHIELASKLSSGCDYCLFKDGIKPMWEDDRNKRGGRWLINSQKNQRNMDLDNYWLETLLCLVGEAFDEESDEVNGAVVQIRGHGDKLAVWTGDVKKADANIKIGEKLKQRLNIPQRMALGYEAHTDTQVKKGSTAKVRYQV